MSDFERWKGILEHQANSDGPLDYKHKVLEGIADLESRLAAAEADAGRYKELRDRLRVRNQTSLAGGEPRPALEVIIGCAFMDQPPKSPGRGDELDAAIDAARGVE